MKHIRISRISISQFQHLPNLAEKKSIKIKIELKKSRDGGGRVAREPGIFSRFFARSRAAARLANENDSILIKCKEREKIKKLSYKDAASESGVLRFDLMW